MGQNNKFGFFGLISQQHKACAASFSVNVSPLITVQPISYFQPNISVVITCLYNIDVQGKQVPPTEAFACSHVVVLGWLSPCTQSLTGVCVQPPRACQSAQQWGHIPPALGASLPLVWLESQRKGSRRCGGQGEWGEYGSVGCTDIVEMESYFRILIKAM